MYYLAAILAHVVFIFALFAAHEYTEHRKAKRKAAAADALMTRAIEKAFSNRRHR